MAAEIKVDAMGVSLLMKKLDDKHVTYATMRTLNDIAFNSRSVMISDMMKAFDKPKASYVKRYVYVHKARKTKLEAWIGLDDFVNKGALFHHFKGGERKTRRFEYALITKGLMRSGYRIVPGAGVKLDRYGNIPASFYSQMMSYLNLHWKSGYSGNMTDKRRGEIAKVRKIKGVLKTVGRKYFAVAVGAKSNLHPGIYETRGYNDRDIRPIMLFVRSGTYKKLFDFFKTVNKVYKRDYRKLFDKHYASALATAR